MTNRDSAVTSERATSEPAQRMVPETLYETAMQALADIGFSGDMTVRLARDKAVRIYRKCRRDEPLPDTPTTANMAADPTKWDRLAMEKLAERITEETECLVRLPLCAQYPNCPCGGPQQMDMGGSGDGS